MGAVGVCVIRVVFFAWQGSSPRSGDRCGRDCDRVGRERDPKKEAMPVVCGSKNIIIVCVAGFFQRGRYRRGKGVLHEKAAFASVQAKESLVGVVRKPPVV